MKSSLKIVLTLCLGMGVQAVWADDAAVLPKNRWRLRWISSFSFADHAFDSSGNSVMLGDEYSQTISTQFLTALRPDTTKLVKTLNAVQPGLGENLPIAVVNAKLDSNVYTNVFVAEYGLTDRLSLGIILPLVHASVEAEIKSEPSAEFKALMGSIPEGHPMKAALSSLQQQMTIEALSSTLKSELGYNAGLSSWSGSGLGDIELGAKYNYYKSHPFVATIKGGVRLPTGRRNDPDELFDIGFGDGQFDLGAFHYLDYHPLAQLYITWEAGYTAQLPHSATYRVPIIDGTDISPLKAKLNRDLGDFWETGLEAHWSFVKTMTFSSKYRYVQKFSDTYSSSDGLNTAALEANTDEERHEANFTLTYSNIPNVRAGRARIPFEASIFYRLPFAGKNIEQLQTAGVQLKSYF